MSDELTFGLSLPNRAALLGLPVRELLACAEIADASGQFGSVWVGDNFLSKPRLESIVTLSALAARTRRVKLGTVCMATFPMRHPIELAMQWATLDQIAEGRTILAVCNGTPASRGEKYAREMAAFGIKSNERVARLEEGIALLRAFWGDGPVTHHGRFWDFDEVEVLPKPAQERVPIVLALNPQQAKEQEMRDRMARRVARLADGWQTDGIPVDVFRTSWEQIQAFADEEGRTLDTASLHLMVNIDDDPQAGRRNALAFLERYYGIGGVSEEKASYWIASGPPEAVIETISKFVDAGCNLPILRFAAEDQRNQLERCLTEVLPAFGVAAAAGAA